MSKKSYTIIIYTMLMLGINRVYGLSVETELSQALSSKDKSHQDIENKISLTAHLLTQGQYRNVLMTAGEILAQEPQNVDGHVLKGAALEGLKQYDKAIDSFLKAIEIDPKESRAYNRLGFLFYNFKNDREKAKDYLLLELNLILAMSLRTACSALFIWMKATLIPHYRILNLRCLLLKKKENRDYSS